MRNHGGIPIIKEDAYFLEIGGLVNETKKLTLRDLKDEKLFPRQTAVVTIQCSGTRRLEQINEYPGPLSLACFLHYWLLTAQVTATN